MENGITPFHLKKKVEQVIYAQLLSSQYPAVLHSFSFDSIIEIKVLARNAMGGYVSDTIHCPLSNNVFYKNSQDTYQLIEQAEQVIKNIDHTENCANIGKLKASGGMAYRIHGYEFDNYEKEYCSNQK